MGLTPNASVTLDSLIFSSLVSYFPSSKTISWLSSLLILFRPKSHASGALVCSDKVKGLRNLYSILDFCLALTTCRQVYLASRLGFGSGVRPCLDFCDVCQGDVEFMKYEGSEEANKLMELLASDELTGRQLLQKSSKKCLI